MLLRSLFVLCVCCLATASPRAQYDGLHDLSGRVATDQQTYESSDGTFTLEVRERDGGPMNSKSSSAVSLRHGGKQIWSREFDLAVQSAGVANRGWCTIVGIGRGDFAPDRLRLVTMMLNGKGEVVMEDARTLVAQNFPHGTQMPRCAGVVVLEAQDAMLVRLILDGPRGGLMEEWRVHDSRGMHDATISVGADLSDNACRWFDSPVIAVRRGRFLVSQRCSGEFDERARSYARTVAVHDMREVSAYPFYDPSSIGRSIWTHEFPADGTELSIAPLVIGESIGAGLTFRRGEAVELFRFLDVDSEGIVNLRRPGDEAEAGD